MQVVKPDKTTATPLLTSQRLINKSNIHWWHTWRKGLLQLVGLLWVKHTQRVKVLGAANFKLHHILAPLDFDRACILSSCSNKKILDLMDLLWLFVAYKHLVKPKIQKCGTTSMFQAISKSTLWPNNTKYISWDYTKQALKGTTARKDKIKNY